MQTLKRFLFIAIAVTISSFVHAQQVNSKLDGLFGTTFKTFKVNGTCEMCKYRIENSVKTLPGIWTRPYGTPTGYAEDHLHLDLGYVLSVPRDVKS